MNNFLYCFDQNYQKPAFTSMFSILENVNEKISFFILQDQILSNFNLPESIRNHPNIDNIQIFRVKLGINFPNLIDVHVSEATYYRLFIEDFINEEVDFITYIDCDVICIRNPIDKINSIIKKLSTENLPIAVMPEAGLSNYGNKKFGIGYGNYFNAGVMIIDYQNWKKNKFKKEFLDILENHNTELNFWDQDVMNIHFDGKYVNLPRSLNYKVSMSEGKESGLLDITNSENNIFLHYSGKFKPWSIRGALNANSKFFHEFYYKLFNEFYYFQFNYNKNALKDLLKGIINFKIFRINNPTSFFYLAIKRILYKYD